MPTHAQGPRGDEQTVFGRAEADLADDSDAIQRGRFFGVREVLDAPPIGGLIAGHDLTIQKAVASYLLRHSRTA